MIQTRRYIAPTDGRKASMKNGQLLTDAQVKRIEQQLQGGMRKIVVLNQNEINQTNRSINALYNKAAQENGMSQREFRKGVSSWAEFSKNMEGYKKYTDWNEQASIKFAKQGGRGFVDFDKSNPYVKYKKWANRRRPPYHQTAPHCSSPAPAVHNHPVPGGSPAFRAENQPNPAPDFQRRSRRHWWRCRPAPARSARRHAPARGL